MFRLLRLILGLARRSLRTRRDLLLENLVLRQQLSVLKRRHAKPKIATIDKLFWVCIRQIWSGWKGPLGLVHPDSVTRWHRAGFRLYWSLLSKPHKPAGRQRISKQVRDLIFRMVVENPTWGAPRIHGELLMLGFDVSERSISRWMKRAPRDPDRAKRWLAFLRNHREAIAAMDFFTVPTITFASLYCFFVMGHDRRRILHFNVTRHPTSAWVIQQLREAFPYESAPRFLIFDRQVRLGGSASGALDGDPADPYLVPKPVAEWRGGAVGGELSAGFAGSRDRFERAPSEAAAVRLCPLLLRRPNPSWLRQADPGRQNPIDESGCRDFPIETGRLAPPL